MGRIRPLDGFVLLMATLATLWLAAAKAAPGDRTFIRRTTELTLNGSQRTGLGTCVSSVWPDAQVAQIQHVVCQKVASQPAECAFVDRRSLTVAQFIALEIDYPSLVPISVAGGNVTFESPPTRQVLSGPQASCFATWINGIWGINGSLLTQLVARRDGSDVRAQVEYNDVASPAAYVQLKIDGVVVRPIGIAE